MNTGLTLRTIRVKDGVAEVRAGATLLYDSDPDEEERETRIKASAFIDAIRRPRGAPVEARRGGARAPARPAHPARRPPGLLRAHAGQLLPPDRRRGGHPARRLRRHATLDELRPDLVVLSPGPGRPRDFDVSGHAGRGRSSAACPCSACASGCRAWSSTSAASSACWPTRCTARPRVSASSAGASSRACPRSSPPGATTRSSRRERFPPCLRVTAETDDGVVMAVEHDELPLAPCSSTRSRS